MWRDLALELLVGLRLLRRPDFIGCSETRHPAPDQLPGGLLVLVRDGARHKWACLRCPGGCGEKIQLNLSPHRRPRWRVRLDWLGRPSISPSVRQLTRCRCHFWITRGAVRWCDDDGRNLDGQPEPHPPARSSSRSSSQPSPERRVNWSLDAPNARMLNGRMRVVGERQVGNLGVGVARWRCDLCC